MTTTHIAERLVKLCREGQFNQAQTELFSNDAISIEPFATPEFQKETRGLPAIREKGKRFSEQVESMHAIIVSDPLVAGTTFACTLRMDVTMKGKPRADIIELCIYQVKDGKIVSEEFHF